MENIKVNDFFDQVYLINLKRRPDKLKTSSDLLKKFNIDFEVFEAVDFCDGIPALMEEGLKSPQYNFSFDSC